jgi:sigma-B regulation protein RsbU (phosphoserine phosphatase)
MTMALAVVDRRRRALRWASAGHNPPIVYDPGARRFLDLKGGGIPLGIEAGAAYEEHAVADLPEAAVIVLATDGVWEARSPDGRMFGHERLRAVIEAHASETGGAILAAIEDALEAFCGGPLTRPVDDITAVVVRLGGV